MLKIGPAPAKHVPECVDPDLPVFPFAYDTDYYFGIQEHQFYTVTVDKLDPVAQPPRHLTFQRMMTLVPERS